MSTTTKQLKYYGLLPDGATPESDPSDEPHLTLRRGVEYAAEVQEIEFTLRQAIKTPAYWILTVAFAVNGFVTAPIMIHGMPLLTDMGIEPVRAALMFSIAGTAAIPTRLAAGFLVDLLKKEHLRFMLVSTSLLIAAGVISFVLNQTPAIAQVLLITFYMGFTANVILNTAVKARYFGRKSLESIQGVTTMIMTPFSVLAPIYAGWIYDTTGSYTTAFNLVAVLSTFVAVLMIFALPPKPPPQVTDVNKFL